MRKFILVLLILAAVKLQAQNTAAQNNITSKADSAREAQLAALKEIKEQNIKRAVTAQFQYFIIKADSATYGYSIYADGHLYIQQNSIPAMAGNKGFADTTTAAKCAQLVIQKIKQGEMPPSVTVGELKKLNAVQ